MAPRTFNKTPHTLDEKISEAIQTLCNALNANYVNFFDENTLTDANLHTQVPNKRYVIATGTYACNAWRYGEDINLVCMTQNTPGIHWRYFGETLRVEEGDDVKLPTEGGTLELSDARYSQSKSGSRGRLVEFVNLSGKDEAGCKFYLHYCMLPVKYPQSNQAFDPSKMATMLIPAYPRLLQSLRVERNLDKVRDTQQYAFDTAVRAQRQKFIDIFRNLRAWADTHGLIDARFGFFNSDALLWMVHGAYLEDWSPRPSNLVDDQGRSLIWVALSHYLELAEGRSLLEERTVAQLLDELHEDITANRFIENLTPEGKEAIVDAVSRIGINDGSNFPDPVMYKGLHRGFKAFLEDFDYFLKVECIFIDFTSHKIAQFKQIAVPENLNKIIKALRDNASNSTYCGMSGRLWPIPIVDNGDQYTYGIGLRRSRNPKFDGEPLKKNLPRIAENLMPEINYDSSVGSIIVSLAVDSELEALLPLQADDTSSEGMAGLSVASSSLNLQGIPSSFGRFRTASEVIDRLTHDPRHIGIEYDVGYMDRFMENLLWCGLERWEGKTVEDDKFIPQHRIRKLKRRSDGAVVWDREKRFDATN